MCGPEGNTATCYCFVWLPALQVTMLRGNQLPRNCYFSLPYGWMDRCEEWVEPWFQTHNILSCWAGMEVEVSNTKKDLAQITYLLHHRARCNKGPNCDSVAQVSLGSAPVVSSTTTQSVNLQAVPLKSWGNICGVKYYSVSVKAA